MHLVYRQLTWKVQLRISMTLMDFLSRHCLVLFAGHRILNLHQRCDQLWLWHVQSAFCLIKSRPAAGPGIFSCLGGASAMCASDTGIVEVVQMIVGNLVLVGMTSTS